MTRARARQTLMYRLTSLHGHAPLHNNSSIKRIPGSSLPKIVLNRTLTWIFPIEYNQVLNMASLTLVPHNEFNHDIKVKAFAIYNEFLQPNSTMTLAKASQELLKILPDISTHSEKAENEAWFFADMSLQLGEQIHYSDPAQLKLIRLFQRMRQDSKPEPWTTPVSSTLR